MVLFWGRHVRTQCLSVRLFVVLPSGRPVVLFVMPWVSGCLCTVRTHCKTTRPIWICISPVLKSRLLLCSFGGGLRFSGSRVCGTVGMDSLTAF